MCVVCWHVFCMSAIRLVLTQSSCTMSLKDRNYLKRVNFANRHYFKENIVTVSLFSLLWEKVLNFFDRLFIFFLVYFECDIPGAILFCWGGRISFQWQWKGHWFFLREFLPKNHEQLFGEEVVSHFYNMWNILCLRYCKLIDSHHLWWNSLLLLLLVYGE